LNQNYKILRKEEDMSANRLMSPSEIAEQAGVALSTVSNWMRRFDDFPQGVIVEGSKRPRYGSDEVSDWLEKRQLSRGAFRDAIGQNSITREERRAVLGALFVVMQRITPPSLRTQESVITEFHQMSKSPGAEILGFDLVSRESMLADLVLLYGQLSDQELADVLVATDDKDSSRSRAPHSTSPLLVEFLGSIAQGFTGHVIDLASGQGRILEYLASHSIGSGHSGRDINSQVVIQARQVARLRGLDITYEVANGFGPVASHSAGLVISDLPLGVRATKEDYDEQIWPLGKPQTQDIATAFIYRAIETLQEGGTAMIVTTSRLLTQGAGVVDFRRELLKMSAIKAVVALPPKLRSDTAVPLALWILCAPEKNLDRVVMVDASLAPLEFLEKEGPVVRALRAELMGDAVNRDENFAVTVPTKELWTKDVALRPNAWVAKKRDLIEPQEQVAILRSEVKSLSNVLGTHPALSQRFDVGRTEPELTSLKELQNRGSIKMARTSFVKASEDGTGLPVLDSRVFLSRGQLQPTRWLQDESSVGLLIEPGDIIVAPAASGVVARVWEEQGWACGPSLQIIRTRDSNWDKSFLTAAIEHPRNLAHIDAGAFKVQANIRFFEVPDIPLGDQQRLTQVLRSVLEAEDELESKLNQIRKSRRIIAEAIASGTVEVILQTGSKDA
jgi:type I restriction-modification system DNA methylase subunit